MKKKIRGRIKRKKGPVNAKKTKHDGIQFASGLEKYTPDFVSDSFIIECKGRANESFPLRWKMFKKYVKVNLPHVTIYKPQNQKECDKVIELITKSKTKWIK